MPIRKPASRFSDRNKIRRMHQQGYSIEQISSHVSITPEHIQYVLEQWDLDEEKAKDQQKANDQERERQFREAQMPQNAKPTIDDEERERIRELARRELLAELEAEKASSEESKPKRRGRPPKEESEAA